MTDTTCTCGLFMCPVCRPAPTQTTEFDRMKAQKDAILAKQRGRLGDLLEVARIKCTRRFQGEDYPGTGGEYRLGVDATSHLREVLALIEEAQKCQSQQ